MEIRKIIKFVVHLEIITISMYIGYHICNVPEAGYCWGLGVLTGYLLNYVNIG